MRIWHQSITDMSALPGYAERLEATGRRVASAGTTIQVHGVLPGSYPAGVAPIEALRSPWAHHLLATQVVMGAVAARRQGFDAVTISCFYDPGLTEAREASGLPVVSACETSVRSAAALGRRAGLLALDDDQRRFLEALVHRHGLAQHVSSVRALDPAVTELDLSGGLDDDELVRVVDAAAAAAIAEGAETIVPAEGVLNARLASLGVEALHGVPVVDSFAALVTAAESLVRDGGSPARPPALDSYRRTAAASLMGVDRALAQSPSPG